MSKLNAAPLAFTFDDFFLIPQHSEVESRSSPSLALGSNHLNLDNAIISAPMNTITEVDMIVSLHHLGATGVLHRYLSKNDQVAMAKKIISTITADGFSNDTPSFFTAIGASDDFLERVAELSDLGLDKFCIDVANGHSTHCLQAVQKIRYKYPKAIIMAGNVCTENGARKLVEAGTNIVRVGIGPGSMCTTRMVTGHGVPQLTAIEECAKIKKEFPSALILADGGLRSSGDIVKAYAIGADIVMIGGLLAGTKETPGEIIEENGRLYKYYAGMASEEGRSKWFDRAKTSFVPEGVSVKVEYTGQTATKVVEKLIGAVKVGMSYAGARSIAELQQRAKWCRVTVAGHYEGTPHGKK